MAKDSDVDKPNPLAPHPALIAYYAHPADRDDFVRHLFDRSAPHYDLINRLFSLGLGDWYRRRSLQRAGLQPGMRVLDGAIGTGAIARQTLAIQGENAAVIGLDVSEGMLVQARRELDIPLVLGRIEQLPMADDSIDFYAVGYALRHVADLGSMFREGRRILRPGGIFLVLEIGIPKGSLYRSIATFYMGQIIPRLSSIVCGTREAKQLMQYYWDTIVNCVPESVILQAMSDAGLAEVRCTIDFGLFRAYVGHEIER